MRTLCRRYALRQLISMFGAAKILDAQAAGLAGSTSVPPDDPLLDPVNVMDFAAIARRKLDPAAWDYLEGGAEEEATLRDNIEGFRKIIIEGGDVSQKLPSHSLRPYGQSTALIIVKPQTSMA